MILWNQPIPLPHPLQILPQKLHQRHHRHRLPIRHTRQRDLLIELARLPDRRAERHLLQLALLVDVGHDRLDGLDGHVLELAADVALPCGLEDAEGEAGGGGRLEVGVWRRVVEDGAPEAGGVLCFAEAVALRVECVDEVCAEEVGGGEVEELEELGNHDGEPAVGFMLA